MKIHVINAPLSPSPFSRSPTSRSLSQVAALRDKARGGAAHISRAAYEAGRDTFDGIEAGLGTDALALAPAAAGAAGDGGSDDVDVDADALASSPKPKVLSTRPEMSARLYPLL